MSTYDELAAIDKQIMELKQERSRLYREIPEEVVDDYEFKTRDGQPIKLSELFGDKEDLLIVHNMGQSCVYCTLWADGLTGFTPHLTDRAAFVLSSPDSPTVLKDFSESRNWNFSCVSTDGNSFPKDMGFYGASGYWPGVSAFRKNADGSIVRTGKTFFGPGDDFCAPWPLFDLLKNGANGWEPKYKY